ncbi:hypothetical protein BZG36_02770 [Bifiguratus adelaidae]|uniref:Autophagy-related protein 11 n=1 Tax=Bifiguratus adelaidae TaxID=1938954 RepID=A0A261Y1X0_9FUNG|nr:hypothetical protein BZG36_02770 [Bifiguratus adelaidae]
MRIFRAESGKELVLKEGSRWVADKDTVNAASFPSLEECKIVIEEATGTPLDRQILMTTAGVQLKPSNMAQIWKELQQDDHALVLFDRQYLEASADMVKAHLAKEARLLRENLNKPLTLFEVHADETDSGKLSQVYLRGFSECLQLAMSHVSSMEREITFATQLGHEVTIQMTCLNVAIINLDVHMRSARHAFDTFEVIANRELMKQSNLLSLVDRDLNLLDRIAFPSIYLCDEALEHAGRGGFGEQSRCDSSIPLSDLLNEFNLPSAIAEAGNLRDELSDRTEELHMVLGELDEEASALSFNARKNIEPASKDDKIAHLQELFHQVRGVHEKIARDVERVHDRITRLQSNSQANNLSGTMAHDQQRKTIQAFRHLADIHESDYVPRLEASHQRLQEEIQSLMAKKIHTLEVFHISMASISTIQSDIAGVLPSLSSLEYGIKGLQNALEDGVLALPLRLLAHSVVTLLRSCPAIITQEIRAALAQLESTQLNMTSPFVSKERFKESSPQDVITFLTTVHDGLQVGLHTHSKGSVNQNLGAQPFRRLLLSMLSQCLNSTAVEQVALRTENHKSKPSSSANQMICTSSAPESSKEVSSQMGSGPTAKLPVSSKLSTRLVPALTQADTATHAVEQLEHSTRSLKLEHSHDKQNNEYASRIHELKRALELAEADCKALRARERDLHSTVDTLEEVIERERASNEQAKRDISILRGRLDDAQTSEQQTRAIIATLSSQVAEASQRFEKEFAARNSQFEEIVQKHQQELQRLLDEESEERQHAIHDALQEQSDVHAEELAQAQLLSKQDADQKVKDYESRIAKYVEKNADLERRLEETEQRLLENNQTNEEIKLRLSQARDMVARAERDWMGKNAIVEQLMEGIYVFRDEVASCLEYFQSDNESHIPQATSDDIVKDTQELLESLKEQLGAVLKSNGTMQGKLEEYESYRKLVKDNYVESPELLRIVRSLSDVISSHQTSLAAFAVDLGLRQELAVVELPRGDNTDLRASEELEAYAKYAALVQTCPFRQTLDEAKENSHKLDDNIKRWQREYKLVRDKYSKLQTYQSEKIAFRNFKVGDIALFLPTRNSNGKPWAAFNVNAPHYFLKSTVELSEQLRAREWVLARIVSIEDRLADAKDPESNPYGLADGIKFYELEVDIWQPTHHVRHKHTRSSHRKAGAAIDPQSEGQAKRDTKEDYFSHVGSTIDISSHQDSPILTGDSKLLSKSVGSMLPDAQCLITFITTGTYNPPSCEAVIAGTIEAPFVAASVSGSILTTTIPSVPFSAYDYIHSQFANFITTLQNGASHTFTLHGAVDIQLNLGIFGKPTLSGLRFNVQTTLSGLQGLKRTSLLEIYGIGTTDVNGNLLVTIGSSATDGAFVNEVMFAFPPTAIAVNIEGLPNSSSGASLEPALSTLNISTSLPADRQDGSQFILKSATIDITSDTLMSGNAQVTFVFESPFYRLHISNSRLAPYPLFPTILQHKAIQTLVLTRLHT